MSSDSDDDDFLIERHGEVTVLTATPSLENFDPTLVDDLAEIMLAPIHDQAYPLVVVDLARVDYFGSAFLQLLLRCWNLVTKVKGGQMVLCHVSQRARELLHLTSLDIIWPIYATRAEAMEAMLSE
jgi:anti-anti-sigma factor